MPADFEGAALLNYSLHIPTKTNTITKSDIERRRRETERRQPEREVKRKITISAT